MLDRVPFGSCRTIMSDSSYLVYALVIVLPLLYLFRRRALARNRPTPAVTAQADDKQSLKTIMQAPRGDLDPPKNDPFTLSQLSQFDGSDPTKPIYVSIKGKNLFKARARRTFDGGT